MYFEDTNELVLDGKVAIFLSKNKKLASMNPKNMDLVKMYLLNLNIQMLKVLAKNILKNLIKLQKN